MFKRLLIFLFMFMLGFSSVSFSANSKASYKDVLSQLIPPNINYDVKVLKSSVIKGFTQLDVIIKNDKMGVKIHRYLWISKDKNSIITTVLQKGTNGRFARLEPKQYIERFAIDINWFNNIIKNLPPEMKKSYGKGKIVYMLSDPYCPYCKKEIEILKKLADKGKIKLHVIPFNVHGKKAEDASLVFISIEKQKGLLAAINEIESASFSDVDKKVNANKKNIEKLRGRYSKYVQNIAKAAISKGVRGTPVVIIPTKDSKGYLIIGLSDIASYVK